MQITHPTDYPEEYTRWFVNFFGRDFIVTPDVLIPRLETECLVRRARKIIESPNHLNNNPMIVVDIGCGSGIIGTSVADLAEEIIFLDISPEALRVTETNFRKYFPNKKAQFILSDLLLNLELGTFNLESTNLLFLTNLPYIRDADWINMSSDTVYEPKLALFWWEKTGFELYERLFTQLWTLHFESLTLIFEFGFDQREVTEKILNQYPNWEYIFFADYTGIERFGIITNK